MSKNLICLLLLFSSSAITAELDIYEECLLGLFRENPNVFQFGSRFVEDAKSLNLDEEKKAKLIDCFIRKREEIYSKAFAPYYKKYLSIGELNAFNNWLKTDYGKYWLLVGAGEMSSNDLTGEQINKINEFAGGMVVRKLELATGESIKSAESAGKELAGVCSEFAGI